MCKKRPAASRDIEITFGRPMKRVKLTHKAECLSQELDCTLPVQPERELGPFWVTAADLSIHGGAQLVNVVEGSCCSLGCWAAELSLSLNHRANSGPLDGSEDDETQDTASSGSGVAPAGHASARHPRACAAGEEDSITSVQPAAAASVAFSFGSRPYLVPDLAHVMEWDIVNGLWPTL